ncbi:hypothetical protein AGMMS50262_03630 [Bacteroidia bacterium]|nr:hypothetical protein AGMMS50262_03630 [Bacteroidia bacterium]
MLFLLFLTATFSLRAQLAYDDIFSPYANSYEIYQTPIDGLYATNPLSLDFETAFSPFSEFLPAGDFLTNKFGASYAGQTAQGYLDTQYSTQETALKIPVGNGTMCLLLIAGIYVLTVFRGLCVKRAMTGEK